MSFAPSLRAASGAGYRWEDGWRDALPARSYSHTALAGLFLLMTATLFAVSGGMLSKLGINYSGVSGSIATKIHPATYLAFITFGLLLVSRRNPASYVAIAITRHPGAMSFLAASLFLGACIVLDDRRGIATIIDTYAMTVIVALIAAELDSRDLRRAERLVHILLAMNAALAIVEYIIDFRLFPYGFETLNFDWDRRSTALLGHPLENAAVTGTYIVILLFGGGSAMPALLRAPATLLQCLALVTFGGRSATVLAILVFVLWGFARLFGALRGRRISLLGLAAVTTMMPVLALALAYLAQRGYFAVVVDRFADDAGSAQTRIEMFELFSQIPLHNLMMGADNDLIESLRRKHGLSFGIENPIVRLLLYQGIALTFFLVATFTFFMVEICRRLRSGIAPALLYFFVVINSFESIANKSTVLAQFLILMLVMYARQQASSSLQPMYDIPSGPPRTRHDHGLRRRLR